MSIDQRLGHRSDKGSGPNMSGPRRGCGGDRRRSTVSTVCRDVGLILSTSRCAALRCVASRCVRCVACDPVGGEWRWRVPRSTKTPHSQVPRLSDTQILNLPMSLVLRHPPAIDTLRLLLSNVQRALCNTVFPSAPRRGPRLGLHCSLHSGRSRCSPTCMR